MTDDPRTTLHQPERPQRVANGSAPTPHRRRLPSLAVLPTLCTLGNLTCGFAAIFYAALDPSTTLLGGWTPLSLAGVLIFVGIFLDAVDGSLARLTRSTSDLGAQLDSLADIVTFGVAPPFITLQLVAFHLASDASIIGPAADTVLGRIIWGTAALYVCCAALRLARFNVEVGLSQGHDHMRFQGLPSPGAAGAVASLIILHQHLLVERYSTFSPGDEIPAAFVKSAALGIPFIMMACAFGMVSSIQYIHVTNRYIQGQRSFAYVVRMVVPILLAIWWFQETVALLFTVYVLSGPIAFIWRKLKRPREAPA